jgi:hypothetical protein
MRSYGRDFRVITGTENQTMRPRFCFSCGGDTSTVPLKKRKFADFVVKVIRCPHCKLRQTIITIRKPGNFRFEIDWHT